MKNFLKGLIGLGCIVTALVGYKLFNPFTEEVVNLNKFTDYYVSDDTSVDGEVENGGVEVLSSNFYVLERDYGNEIATTPTEVSPEGTEEIKQEVVVEQKQEYKVPEKEIHIVKAGDTLSGIAEKYNMDLEILRANNPKVKDKINAGDEITVLKENGIFYKVEKGDSLYRIASKYKVKIDDLKKYNNEYVENLRPGNEIFIKDPDLSVVNRLLVAKTTVIKKTPVVKTGSTNSKSTESKSKKSYVRYDFNMPVKWAGISSPYGNRFHPVLKRYIQHTGVDLRAKYVPLHASKDGRVAFAGYMSGYGKIIIIKHNDGYETRSAHLNKIYVKNGESVKSGEVIGQTGMSGRVTGPHLHFEIRKNNRPYDPMRYLKR